MTTPHFKTVILSFVIDKHFKQQKSASLEKYSAPLAQKSAPLVQKSAPVEIMHEHRLQTFANQERDCKLLRTKKFGSLFFSSYLCTMIYEIVIGILIYAVLFVVTVLSSRRKMLALQQRIDKVRALQESQQAQSEQNIRRNEAKILELETLLQKLGNENSLLRLELEEKKATLDYNNKVAMIENEKRQQAETVIFASEVYSRIQECLTNGRPLTHRDWTELAEMVNSVYSGFTEKLFNLYRLSEQDYHVSLLIKVRVQPKDIALLTAHSKESVASTRSRLYQKVFGRKGSSKDWDDFVLTL